MSSSLTLSLDFFLFLLFLYLFQSRARFLTPQCANSRTQRPLRCRKFETSLLPFAQVRTPVRPAGDFFLLFGGEMCCAFLSLPFHLPRHLSLKASRERRPPRFVRHLDEPGFCHSGKNLVSATAGNDLAPLPRDFRARRQPRFVRHVEATTLRRPRFVWHEPRSEIPSPHVVRAGHVGEAPGLVVASMRSHVLLREPIKHV